MHDTRVMESAASTLHPMELPPLPERPLVSVLIANYNYEKYLPEALNSLLAQTYERWEAIVCDDGSTDGSRAIIQSYASRDSRVRYVFQPNGGVASALNAAYKESAGEIIALLDADDVFLPHKLQIIVEVAILHGACGLLVHRVRIVDASGANTSGPIPVTLDEGWLGPVMFQGVRLLHVPPASGIAIRREVAELVFPVPTYLKRGVDCYVSRAAAIVSPMAHSAEVMSLYRVHGSNITACPKGSEEESRLGSVREYHLLFQAENEFLVRICHPRDLLPEQIDSCRWALLACFLVCGNVPTEYYSGTVDTLLACETNPLHRKVWAVLCRLPRRWAILGLHLWTRQYRCKRLLRLLWRWLGLLVESCTGICDKRRSCPNAAQEFESPR